MGHPLLPLLSCGGQLFISSDLDFFCKMRKTRSTSGCQRINEKTLYAKYIGWCLAPRGRINPQCTSALKRDHRDREKNGASATQSLHRPAPPAQGRRTTPVQAILVSALPTARASRLNPCSQPCSLQSIRMILIKCKQIMTLLKAPQ